MNTQEINRLIEHYESMQDDEIAIIHANSQNLTAEASEALSSIIKDRKIDLAQLRQDEAEEAFQQDELRKVAYLKKEKRNYLLLKIGLIIGIPVIIFRAVTEPEQASEHAYQALLSVIIQTIILAVVLGAFSGVKKMLNKK